MTFSGVFLLLLMLLSCNDNMVDIDSDHQDGSFTDENTRDSILLWRYPLHPDTVRHQSMDFPVLYRDRIVFSRFGIGAGASDEVISVDTSGVFQWGVDNINPHCNLSSVDNGGVVDDHLYVTDMRTVAVLDVETGTIVASQCTGKGQSRISNPFGNYLVWPQDYLTSAPKSDSTAILAGDMLDGGLKTVFTVERQDSMDAVSIPSVLTYQDDVGDTIMVFQVNSLYIFPYAEVIDLYSYNVTQDKIEWRLDSLSIESWNINAPVMDEDNVYFATKWSFFSIDKHTGEINWERRLFADFQGSNYLLYEDKIITNLDQGDLIALDKHTGNTAWHNVDLSECCVDLSIHGDKLYMGNDDLFIVDPSNGKLLWRYTTPTQREQGFGGADFNDAILVDLDAGRMYAVDGYYLLCMRHPDL